MYHNTYMVLVLSTLYICHKRLGISFQRNVYFEHISPSTYRNPPHPQDVFNR